MAMSIKILDKKNILDNQVRWDISKFEIGKFFIHYSISKTRERKGERIILETKIKAFEQDLEKVERNQEYLDCKIERNQEYLDCKRKLDDIFDQKVESIKIRSKCKRYEEGEKNSKFYFNLGKLW